MTRSQSSVLGAELSDYSVLDGIGQPTLVWEFNSEVSSGVRGLRGRTAARLAGSGLAGEAPAAFCVV